MLQYKRLFFAFMLAPVALLVGAGCQDHHTANDDNKIINIDSLRGLRCAPCGDPPANTCVDQSVVGYTEVGFCEETDPSLCRYSPFSISCGAQNQICRNGACVDANTPYCAEIVLDGRIDPSTTTLAGSTLGATADHISSCGYGYNGSDVIYVWSPPADGCYTIDTIGSAFDTILDVWPCDREHEVYCNDDSGESHSIVHLNALASQPYAIAIDGYGASASGDFVLNISPCGPCTEIGCTASPPSACTDNNARRFYDYYGYCDDDTGICDYPFEDIPCDEPPSPACEGDVVVSYEAQGLCDDSSGVLTCRYVRANSIDCAASGQICFARACHDTLPACPVGFIDATLSADTTTYAGSTVDAVDDYTSFYGYNVGPDRAFVWSPPADGCYVIDVQGSGFYALLDIFLCADRSFIMNGNYFSFEGNSGTRAVLDVLASESYALVIDSDGESGDFTLNINPCGPCENVACSTPPPDDCGDNNAVRRYENYGDCDESKGTCNYDFQEIFCENPPRGDCEGDVLIAYEAMGTCDDTSGVPRCLYTPLDGVDCAALGQFCFAGACRDELPACRVSTDAALSSDTTTYAGSTAGASGDFTAYCNSSIASSPDLAFVWRPPADGCYVIDTIGSSLDTVLDVKGCDDGYSVVCNDDFDDEDSLNHDSRVAFNASIDETYALIVDGYGNSSGAFMLNISHCGPCELVTCHEPPPDTCTPEAIRSFDYDGTCDPSGGTSTCVYAPVDDPCDTPPPPACEGNALTTYASLGACDESSGVPTCRYAAASAIDCAARGQVCFAGACLDEAPVCQVSPLEGFLHANTTRYTGSTLNAGNDFASECGGYEALDWAVVWSPPMGGCYLIDTQGSSFDTILEARRCADASVVTCNDDFDDFDDNASQITLYVTAGEVYTLIVDGFNSYSGDFVLNINPCP